MIRPYVEDHGKFVRVLLALCAGGAGFGLNLLALPLGWGVHLVFGSVIPLVLFRILPGWYFVASFSLASSATMLIWLHPYAWLVWTFEAVALIALRRKANPILSVTVFWVLFGLPLIAFFYGYIMSMPWESAVLICVKQFYNAVLCIVVAEILYAAAAYSQRARWSYKLPRVSIASLCVATATSAVALPAIYFITWDSGSNDIIARERLDRRVTAAGKAATDQVSEYVHSLMYPFLVNSNPNESARYMPLFREHSDSSAVIAAVRNRAQSGEGLAAGHERWNVISGQYNTCRSACQGSEERATDSPGITGYAITSDAILFKIENAHRSDTSSVYLAVNRNAVARVIHESLENDDTLYAIVAPRGDVLAVGGTKEQQKTIASIADRERGAPPYSQVVPNASKKSFGSSIMNRLRTGLSYRVSSFPDMHGLRLITAQTPGSTITAIRERQLRLLSAILALVLGVMAVAQVLAGRLSETIEKLVSILKTESGTYTPGSLTSVSTTVIELEKLKTSSLALQDSYVERQDELDDILQRIESMLHSIPIVIYVCRVEGGRKSSLQYVSASITALVGVSPSAAYEPGWWSHSVHPDDFPYVKKELEGIQIGDVRQVEYRIRSVDGSYTPVEETLRCSWSSVNKGPEAIGILISKEESASMRKEIRQAAKLASLGEMSAGLAHELNQPLNTINMGCSSLELALKGQYSNVDEVEPIMATIRDQTRRAANLVQRLKIFAKPGDEEFAVVNVADAVHASVQLTAHECARRGIEVVVEIDSDLETRGSEVLLEQCFINFILNAAEAIDESDAEYVGGAAAHNRLIAISATADEDYIVLEFLDTGPGFKDDALEHACEPFFSSKGPSGTGLGLSVSYSLIHEHHGRLQLRNHANGAKVEVTLPRELSDGPTSATPSTRK